MRAITRVLKIDSVTLLLLYLSPESPATIGLLEVSR